LIATFLGDVCGKIRVTVRGIRKGYSSLIAGLDLFAEGEIIFHSSERSNLHTLKEFQLIDAHSPAHHHYRGLLTCSYFADLLDRAVEPCANAPEYFDLLHRALCYLDQNPPDLQAILHFEKQLADLLGLPVNRNDPQSAIRLLVAHCGNNHLLPTRKQLINALE